MTSSTKSTFSAALLLGLAALFTSACANSTFTGDSAKAAKKNADAKPAHTTDPSGGTGGGPTGGSPGTSTTGGATGSGGGTTSGPSTGVDVGSGTPSFPPSIGSGCGSAGVTQANLLTQTLPNYAQNVVEYQIFLTDCDGKVRTLTSDFMAFDVNATAGGIGKGVGLTYAITDWQTNAPLASGTLMEIPNSDLFGNIGPDFFHYQTDQQVHVTSGATSFRLRITLPSACCAVPDTVNPGADQNIDSFLRFGQSQPVKKVVLFKAAPPPSSPSPLGP